MILRETVVKNIPVIGLVNSNEATRITYPIFGNSDSAQVVHFFCSFLALLLAKSYIQQEYKHASHRLFHRTRVFLNTQKPSQSVKNIHAFSRKYLRAKNQLFLTKRREVKRKRLILYYNRFNSTVRKATQNLNNFARIKKSPKNRRLNTKNKNKNKSKTNELRNDKLINRIKKKQILKLRPVGIKPY
jgi:hypothetical protein